MPYDDRLDGVKSEMKGTRSDFPQRAARHFVNSIWTNSKRANYENHAQLVEEALRKMGRPTPIPERVRLNDNQIEQLMIELWDYADGKVGRMLRILRDEKKVACEQKRCSEIFKRAKNRRLALI